MNVLNINIFRVIFLSVNKLQSKPKNVITVTGIILDLLLHTLVSITFHTERGRRRRRRRE